MTLSGGCHCGAVRYDVATDTPHHHAICHCTDCRRSSGGFMVGWALFDDGDVTITGDPARYASSAHGERLFCIQCGTSLFYRNPAVFPGQTDIQTATLDDPERLPAQAQIQLADRIGWVGTINDLPGFDRFPGE